MSNCGSTLINYCGYSHDGEDAYVPVLNHHEHVTYTNYHRFYTFMATIVIYM